jgi:hypothetical protein
MPRVISEKKKGLEKGFRILAPNLHWTSLQPASPDDHPGSDVIKKLYGRNL